MRAQTRMDTMETMNRPRIEQQQGTRRTGGSGTHLADAGLFAFALCILCIQTLPAQVRMEVDTPRIQDFPVIRIPLQVFDNSAVLGTLSADNFTVLEDGSLRSPLTLNCDRETVDSVVNFMFVLDVSLSMGFIEGTRIYDSDSVKWRNAKQVGSAAFGTLRPRDNGALISFGEFPRLEQDYTTNTTFLRDALYGLRLRSGTGIYDAIIYAVQHPRPVAGKSVIILMTDGEDVSSRHTMQDAIDTASAARIPVYTIGLGVDPGYIPVLQTIATRTGGECHIAPTSNELAEAFDRILKSIISNRCLLSYTTPDTCRRGGTHSVIVTFTYGPLQLTEYTAYTVQDFTPHIALAFPSALETEDDRDVLVPVLVDGPLSGAEDVSFDMTIDYSSASFSFSGIETAGALLDGAVIGATDIGGNRVRVAAQGAQPVRSSASGVPEPLFFLRFQVKHHETNAQSTLALSLASFSQNCPAESGDTTVDITVLGCPDSLALSIAPGIVADAGADFLVLIRLSTPIDVNQPFRYSFQLTYDTIPVSYAGFTTEGTMSKPLDVRVDEPVRGLLSVTAPEGMVTEAAGILLTLRFSAHADTRSHAVDMRFANPLLAQSCVPRLAVYEPPVLVNGFCERVLSPVGSIILQQNRPNPFTSATGGRTMIRFHLASAGRTRIEVRDLYGRQVALLLDAHLESGEHDIAFDASSLPSGTYSYSITQGTETRARLLVWNR